MYSKYEKPIIRASIFYYDIEYNTNISSQVLEILEKYNMYPPEKIYADKLTKNKFIVANENTKELFVKAYGEKDVLEIDMASGNSRIVTDYWRVIWGLTFYKNSKLPVKNPKFMPWNILSIDSTYGRLQDENIYQEYFSCIKELIALLKPFYASIDDVDNKVKLMDKARAEKFEPDHIQQIYWGNYFGSDHCLHYGKEKVERIPAYHVEEIDNGVLFFLSDNVLEFNSKECRRNRRKIKRYLKLFYIRNLWS